MTRTLAALLLLPFLAACGADGAPNPPPAKPAAQSAITLSGDARMGIVSGQ